MSHSSSAHGVRRAVAVAVGVALAVGTAMGPASAGQRNHQAGAYVQRPTPYHDTGTFDPGCSGVKVDLAYDYRGVSSIRRARGTQGQAFFLEDGYRFTERWTDASTGKLLLTYRGREHFQEVRAVRVPKAAVPADAVPPEGLTGPIYRFTSVDREHSTVRDATGERLYRTAGVVVAHSLQDSLGDHAPGSTGLTFDPVKVVGPHPLLHVDLCDVAAEQAG
jgi:hypothetical protein